jgi:hypothetical protein
VEKTKTLEVQTDFIQHCVKCGVEVEGKPLGFQLDKNDGVFKVNYVQYPPEWSHITYNYVARAGYTMTFSLPMCPACTKEVLGLLGVDPERYIRFGGHWW